MTQLYQGPPELAHLLAYRALQHHRDNRELRQGNKLSCLLVKHDKSPTETRMGPKDSPIYRLSAYKISFCESLRFEAHISISFLLFQ